MQLFDTLRGTFFYALHAHHALISGRDCPYVYVYCPILHPLNAPLNGLVSRDQGVELPLRATVSLNLRNLISFRVHLQATLPTYVLQPVIHSQPRGKKLGFRRMEKVLRRMSSPPAACTPFRLLPSSTTT